MSMAQPTTIKSGDQRNDVVPAAPKGYSKFDLSHRFLQTMRFGEITPHCSFEVVKGDIASMRLMNDTSSYSLKAPIKTDMFEKRSNFFVPLQSIIYNNWELLVTQPVSGDDVPNDVDGVVPASTFNSVFGSILNYLKTDLTQADTIPVYLSNYFKTIIAGEMYFSQGSLCKQLGIDFSHCFEATRNTAFGLKTVTFDSFIEQVLNALAPVSSTGNGYTQYDVRFFDENNVTTDLYSVVADENLSENPAFVVPGSGVYQKINFRHFLDLARQNVNFEITSVYSTGSFGNPDLFGEFWFDPSDPDSGTSKEVNIHLRSVVYEDVNFDKLSAYQLCCAHFFSIDHVDYIYSAQLYRQLMQYYAETDKSGTYTFTWNGLSLTYDALSGNVIKNMLYFGEDPSANTSPSFSYVGAYSCSLLSFRHSLRYLDYFTGGRTNPLSVGTAGDQRADVSVPVVNSSVNGVDVILAQNGARFLNFAQRTGRKISKWLDDLFPGGQPKPDMHDPQWLSTTGDALEPEQVQNTGAVQATDANSITARFKQDSNRYMFKVMPDRPGYVICVTYFDVPRAYAYATDKENLHKDRYDRFNPFMQYDGSQSVLSQEIGLAGAAPFSYQNRYEEYKQSYDRVAGGFVENLPGFAFIADVQSGLPMQPHLNPTYVRSWNTELDPFYLALTGYGLAAYFHFIVKNQNIITAQRPMEYQPQLM